MSSSLLYAAKIILQLDYPKCGCNSRILANDTNDKFKNPVRYMDAGVRRQKLVLRVGERDIRRSQAVSIRKWWTGAGGTRSAYSERCI